MNAERAPEWLPTLLVPFFTLSYPAARPEVPDSFPDSDYYTPGLLDGFFVITCIAVMAVLRDVFRVFILEPFAHWYLTRTQTYQKLKDSANGSVEGVTNGNGYSNGSEKSNALRKKRREERVIRRSVIRFAEQGWSVIYYTVQWGFGLVSKVKINLN